MNTTQYEKLLVTLRYWLHGLAANDERYFVTLEALEFFSELHKHEIRKDGVTKGFYHQLNILSFARTQHANLIAPWDVYTAILGHDGPEDYPEQSGRIQAAFPLHYHFLIRLSKIRDGKKVSALDYYSGMAQCSVCSIAKAIDRVNNFSTMAGVFNVTKQEEYAQEGREHFLPMLKTARRLFPRQEAVYELLKSVLTMQIQATDHLVDALKRNGILAELAETELVDPFDQEAEIIHLMRNHSIDLKKVKGLDEDTRLHLDDSDFEMLTSVEMQYVIDKLKAHVADRT